MTHKIIALIPARSGSKGIPNKNIKLYKGEPLLAHSIKVALKSKYINDVYVSSDSIEYNKIALEYGAKVILRPIEIADDLSPDIDTFMHFLHWYNKSNETDIICKNDIIIHLRPTYPNRTVELLDKCIEYFLKNIENYDSLRTVKLTLEIPFKMYYIKDDILTPFIKSYSNYTESFNQARQIFPECYIHNGCIDIIKVNIIKDGVLSGTKILPFIMDENYDIDTLNDFILSETKSV